MGRRSDRLVSGMRAVIHEIRREDVTFMAASIAYHAFVSMLPILLLLILIVSALGSEQFDATVVEITRTVLPAAGQEVVADALRDATTSVGLSLVGIGVLLWGTSKIFRAMDAAFAEIYDTERKLSILDQLRDAAVVLVALAVAAVGLLVLGTFVEIPAVVPYAWVLNGLLMVFALTIVFFPIYYVFPNIDVSLPEVIPGVIVAAVGWVGLKWLFNLYVSFSSKPDVFGLIGTLVLLVTWLYVGSLVLLVGAAVNATLAGRGGDRANQKGWKRRFGRPIADVDGFEGRLDELIGQADDADVPEEEIRRTLRRQAETVGASSDGRLATAIEDGSGPDQTGPDRTGSDRTRGE